MAKVWCGIALVFCLVAAGEFFYFDAQLKRWNHAAADWQTNLDTAKRAAADAALALTECQAKPDSAECARNLAICLKAAPNALNNLADADTPPVVPSGATLWPVFLRPDAKGQIPIIKKYYLSTIIDWNTFKIMGYGAPEWHDDLKRWVFDVQVRSISKGNEYFIYNDTFYLRKDGEIMDVQSENTGVKP